MRVDQAAVPLVGEAGDRDAGGQMRVHQHDEEDAGGARDPEPDAGRTAVRTGSAAGRRSPCDADHREGDGERPVRSQGAPEGLVIAELMEVIHIVGV